jgi:hypothetical protein
LAMIRPYWVVSCRPSIRPHAAGFHAMRLAILRHSGHDNDGFDPVEARLFSADGARSNSLDTA